MSEKVSQGKNVVVTPIERLPVSSFQVWHLKVWLRVPKTKKLPFAGEHLLCRSNHRCPLQTPEITLAHTSSDVSILIKWRKKSLNQTSTGNYYCGSVKFWCGSSVPLSNGSGCGSGTLVKSHKEVTKQQKSMFVLLFFA
jgi:hypothetical protein